jgi:hypothetical protein
MVGIQGKAGREICLGCEIGRLWLDDGVRKTEEAKVSKSWLVTGGCCE